MQADPHKAMPVIVDECCNLQLNTASNRLKSAENQLIHVGAWAAKTLGGHIRYSLVVPTVSKVDRSGPEQALFSDIGLQS